ncbi:MAG TPA: hypothetical protein VFR15_10755, partial [Chloroflexia bacterium]|nr:hypothetical protein [Chloroflexia bacterium]
MTFGYRRLDISIFRPIEAGEPVCYARSMAHTRPASDILGSGITRDAVAGAERAARRERGWKVWLAPRPFTLVSTGVYVTALLMLLQGNCDACGSWGADALLAGTLVGLLLLDRLDYLLYGETPPRKAGLVLMGARFALTAAAAAMFGFDGRSLNVFLFALLPYVALFYFDLKWSQVTGAVVWVTALALMAVASIQRLTVVTVTSKGQTSWYYLLTPSTANEYIGWVAMGTIVLVFVLTSARVTSREKEHAARAGRLLARLDASHAWLNHYAQKT